jgi:peptidase E
MIVLPEKSTCKKCGELKNAWEYQKNLHYTDSTCKACRRKDREAGARKYYIKDYFTHINKKRNKAYPR